jgi:hypothetical protein
VSRWLFILLACSRFVNAEMFVTVYVNEGGCTPIYREMQVSEDDLKCDRWGCQARINGQWREVLLRKPKE